MKLRHTLGLLVLLLVLCALYYGLQYHREHREVAMRTARQLFDFEPDQVRRLTVNRIDGPACTAERGEDGAWRILEPNPTITPFQMMWERVATHAAHVVNEHTVDARPGDLGQYGLDVPNLTVAGETKAGDAFELRFGDLEPTQRHRYAQLDDGALFLVNTDTFFELNRSLTDLRHRYLVANREVPLLDLEFAWIWDDPDQELETREAPPEVGEESIAVRARKEAPDASWRMITPEEAPANHDVVQALADEIQFAVARDFIDTPEDLHDYGLNPPRARITVKDAEKEQAQTLWLGAPDDSPERSGIFARREGEDAVIVIDPHIITLLPTSPLEWRDRRLLTRRVSNIYRLEYATEMDRFVLSRAENGQWQLTTPAMDHVNALAVSGFLSFFREVEGDEFVTDIDTQQVFATPTASIHLYYDDGADAEIAVAPHPDEPDVFLAQQDTGGIVTLSQAATRMLITDSENFRSRELLRFVKGEVTALVFTFDDEKYDLFKRHNRWHLRAPEGMELHNQADVHTLMDAVNPLFMTGAAVLETPDDLDAYGLDTPVFDLVISFEDDVADKQLQIGAPNPANPDERYARSSEREGIYLISQEVMDEIREALRGIY